MTEQLFSEAQVPEPNWLRSGEFVALTPESPVFSDAPSAVEQTLPDTPPCVAEMPSRFSEDPDIERHFAEVKEVFDGVFKWKQELSHELFHRIAGRGELSDELGEKLIDLYIASRTSTLQEPAHQEGRYILNMFSRPHTERSGEVILPLLPAQIRERLATLYPDNERYQLPKLAPGEESEPGAESKYVTGRLLTIIGALCRQAA